jgi:hypothetical protein
MAEFGVIFIFLIFSFCGFVVYMKVPPACVLAFHHKIKLKFASFYWNGMAKLVSVSGYFSGG